MRRSKQQAMALLAGALIVGGVAGVAGNSWYTERSRAQTGFRGLGERLFDDLGLSCEQRLRMDSILQATQDKVQEANAPLRARADAVLAPARAVADSVMAPARARADSILGSGRVSTDSIRAAGREAFLGVMTGDQRHRYETLMAEAARQREEWEKRGRDRSDQDEVCGGALSRGERGVFRTRSAPGDGRRSSGAGPATGRDTASRRAP